MRRLFTALCLILCTAGAFALPCTYAADDRHGEADVESVMRPDSTSETVFYFKPRTSMFFFEGNEEPIRRAGELITRWRKEIDAGEVYVMVQGYCASFRTEYSNHKMASLRSSQVKSYYITNFGLKEENYITSNYTTSYKDNGDVVTVFRLVHVSELDSLEDGNDVGCCEESPVSQPMEGESTEQDSTVIQQEGEFAAVENTDASDVLPLDQTEEDAAVQEPNSVEENTLPSPRREGTKWEDSRWRIKTNIPAWAMVVANLAAEYRFAEHWSVELPVYFSAWTTSSTYRLRTLSAQPSVRYWLSPEWKGHFFGVHLTAGHFNVSVDSKFRYQDVNGMYGVGLDYGYAMKLSECWGLEFNIGAGLIHTKYDTFYNIEDGARFETRTKNYWGITRFGISLIYKIK